MPSPFGNMQQHYLQLLRPPHHPNRLYPPRPPHASKFKQSTRTLTKDYAELDGLAGQIARAVEVIEAIIPEDVWTPEFKE